MKTQGQRLGKQVWELEMWGGQRQGRKSHGSGEDLRVKEPGAGSQCLKPAGPGC